MILAIHSINRMAFEHERLTHVVHAVTTVAYMPKAGFTVSFHES